MPTLVGHAVQPWRLIGPAMSILRTKGSRGILDALATRGGPDLRDPRRSRPHRAASPRPARRPSGPTASSSPSRRGGHSWLLRDPETLPAIVDELLEGRLGDAIREAIGAAGAVSTAELEAIFYEPDAPILALTPGQAIGRSTSRTTAPATAGRSPDATDLRARRRARCVRRRAGYRGPVLLSCTGAPSRSGVIPERR